MLSVYTNKSILNEILEDSAPENIYAILMSGHIATIHLPEEEPENEIGDMGIVDDLIHDLEQIGTTIVWDDNTTNDISAHNEYVTYSPNAIYILDINPKKADFISKKYGVLCMSSKEINDEILTKSYEFDLEQGDDKVSWETFIKCGANSMPSNSMIISDRYLFSISEKAGKQEAWEAIELGVINIKCILNNLLPKNLNVSYKVYIIFDSSTIRCNDPHEKEFEKKQWII